MQQILKISKKKTEIENKEEIELNKPIYSRFAQRFSKNTEKKETPKNVIEIEETKTSKYRLGKKPYSIEKEKEPLKEATNYILSEPTSKFPKFSRYSKGKFKIVKKVEEEEETKPTENKNPRFGLNKLSKIPKPEPKQEKKQEKKEEKNIEQTSYQRRRYFKTNNNDDSNKEKEKENEEKTSTSLKKKFNAYPGKKETVVTREITEELPGGVTRTETTITTTIIESSAPISKKRFERKIFEPSPNVKEYKETVVETVTEGKKGYKSYRKK